MARPDLSTREGRQAYRTELRGVARDWRWSALALLATSVIILTVTASQGLSYLHSGAGQSGLIILAVAIVVTLLAIGKRTAYHRRRMAEPEA